MARDTAAERRRGSPRQSDVTTLALRTLILLAVLLAGPLLVIATGRASLSGDWRTASRASTGLAPDPATTPEAVIQVYGARAFRWRGAFSVHTWISVKRAGAARYRVYEVIGWHGANSLKTGEADPDRLWYGARPELYLDLRGPRAAALIDRIEAAVASYPYEGRYRTWPGPNSNTFTAFVARKVPELGLELPPTAVGKDYLGAATFFVPAPSGSGYQVSLFGLAGALASVEEGLEVHLLGLTFGVDPLDLAVKVPGLGRLPSLARADSLVADARP
jgi:hypothetical protein